MYKRNTPYTTQFGFTYKYIYIQWNAILNAKQQEKRTKVKIKSFSFLMETESSYENKKILFSPENM